MSATGAPAADQKAGGQTFQTNLIQPEPCQFLSPDLPPCSVIRPTLSATGGPMATVQSFIADGLFKSVNTSSSCSSLWNWRRKPSRHATKPTTSGRIWPPPCPAVLGGKVGVTPRLFRRNS